MIDIRHWDDWTMGHDTCNGCYTDKQGEAAAAHAGTSRQTIKQAKMRKGVEDGSGAGEGEYYTT